MKHIKLFASAAFLVTAANLSAQVGVNTTAPNSTMDISAKRDTSGNIVDNTQLIGLQAPRLTRAELTANTATYGANQKGAQIYITDVSGGTAAGQRVNITTTGYYTFDGTLWQKMQDTNIYTGNGSLTGNRVLTQNGYSLQFNGTSQSTVFYPSNGIYQQTAGTGTRASMRFDASGSTLDLFVDKNSIAQIVTTGSSTGLALGNSFTNAPGFVSFSTTPTSGVAGTERMRISSVGNVGIATQNLSTELLDVNGNTRLRALPLDGATNAIFTTSGGSASASRDQTFTATRTVVADANGVLGYVAGTPSSPGVPKLVVSAGVPGTQNIGNSNNLVGNFSVEYLDVYNAWTSNVFTIPAGQGGIYIIAMQSSHLHTTEAGSWFTIARIQKSTDGGTTWTTVLNDTSSNNLGADLDNGNKLYWTSALNAGDKIRIVYQCNSTANNIVILGSVTVTQLNQ
ncbi:hypothetical protein GCM10022217_24220 [Chryseobacterium ginsenosidimutans]|uniref:hypothetical protein n=1 Tax=Chryseobacterium ginsenosidimutans TaxID=687846 RepID=UPI0031CFBABF